MHADASSSSSSSRATCAQGGDESVEESQQTKPENLAVGVPRSADDTKSEGEARGRGERPCEQAKPVAVGTLLTDDSFLPGATALCKSLRVHNKDILENLVCLCVVVTPQVSRTSKHILRRRLGAEIIEVESIANAFTTHVQGWDAAGLSKLRLWTLTQFSRFIYIDADCVVTGSIQDLCAVELGPYGLAAAPDIVPPDRFNAGVLVLRPDQSVFARMQQALEQGTFTSYDGGDTGFLNAFYSDWYQWPKANRLGFRYNAQRLAWHLTRSVPSYWITVDPCIIHYSSTPKPWDPGANKGGELESMWWQYYTKS